MMLVVGVLTGAAVVRARLLVYVGDPGIHEAWTRSDVCRLLSSEAVRSVVAD